MVKIQDKDVKKKYWIRFLMRLIKQKEGKAKEKVCQA